MRNIKKGDIVWLKSGGPKMTVQQIEEENRCKCVWFQYGEIQAYNFERETLTLTDPYKSIHELQNTLLK